MAASEVLKSETRNHVRLLTLNRPQSRNALSAELLLALAEAVIDADDDPEVFVVALTGAGDQAFCAGADLKEARDRADSGKVVRGPLRSARRVITEVLIDARKPSIAIINGPALAGGFEIALACDIRVAADSAFFALPEAKLGRGAHLASVILPQMVPPGIAMEWLLTGRRIAMAEAERWGLVNRVVPQAEVLSAGLALAETIAESAPLSLQRIKLTYRKTHGLPLNSAIRLDTGPDVYASEDQKEGTLSFLEKRKPAWKAR